MSNWVGRFSLILALVFASWANAEGDLLDLQTMRWASFADEIKKMEERDRRDGLSYIISGSLALAGGFAGSTISKDPIENLVYVAFQSIGVASIGYGAYQWRVGSEDRLLFQSLQGTQLTPEQRTAFLRMHGQQRKERLLQERRIKALTHGLIAALNFINASQQKQDRVRNSLIFIGGVNALACITFTF